MPHGLYSLRKETEDNKTTNCDKCYKGNQQGEMIQQGRHGLPIVGRVIREGLSGEVIFLNCDLKLVMCWGLGAGAERRS